MTAAAALLWVAVEQGTDPHPLAAAVHDDGDSLFGRHLNHARAHLQLAQGRTAQGVTELLAVGEREAAIGWTGPAQFPWRSEAALALASLGENERARELVADESSGHGRSAPRGRSASPCVPARCWTAAISASWSRPPSSSTGAGPSSSRRG